MKSPCWCQVLSKWLSYPDLPCFAPTAFLQDVSIFMAPHGQAHTEKPGGSKQIFIDTTVYRYVQGTTFCTSKSVKVWIGLTNPKLVQKFLGNLRIHHNQQRSSTYGAVTQEMSKMQLLLHEGWSFRNLNVINLFVVQTFTKFLGVCVLWTLNIKVKIS